MQELSLYSTVTIAYSFANIPPIRISFCLKYQNGHQAHQVIELFTHRASFWVEPELAR